MDYYFVVSTGTQAHYFFEHQEDMAYDKALELGTEVKFLRRAKCYTSKKRK